MQEGGQEHIQFLGCLVSCSYSNIEILHCSNELKQATPVLELLGYAAKLRIVGKVYSSF